MEISFICYSNKKSLISVFILLEMILTFDEYAPVYFRENSPSIPEKLLKKIEDKIVRFSTHFLDIDYERWILKNMFKLSPSIETWHTE